MTANLEDLRIDRRRSERPARAWVWAVVTVVLLVAGAGGWWWAGRSQAASVRTITVREVAGGPSAGAVLNATGYVTARRRATVSSKITGKVLEVLIEEGMAVKQGQVLARLDDSTPRAELALAEAELAAARRNVRESEVRLAEARLNLGRTQQLVNEGVSGSAMLDTARAEVDSLLARVEAGHQQVDVAERAVAVRRTALDDTIVRAPFSGIAISKDAQPGEMVSPAAAGGGFTRTGIGTIVDMTSLEIEVDVSETYINRVKPGQKVEAALDAYPDWRIPAHVITTVPTADRQKATVLVRVGFDALDPRILPDMGIKVAFLEERPADAPARARLMVPKTAIRTIDARSVVFVVKNDRVERRAVRAGAEDGDQIEVISGLNPGEQIVVEGPPTLSDGDPVVTL
jgi:RND family efflux transporter MFP subunit